MKRKDPLKNLTNRRRADVSSLMMNSLNGLSHQMLLNAGFLRKLFFEHYVKLCIAEIFYNINMCVQSKRKLLCLTIRGQPIAYYTISYCHLSVFGVSKGMFVNAGEVLGVSGSSGMSTGPHLHLTTKKDGKVFDPVILLKYVHNIKSQVL